jgi:hypothetical protein
LSAAGPVHIVGVDILSPASRRNADLQVALTEERQPGDDLNVDDTLRASREGLLDSGTRTHGWSAPAGQTLFPQDSHAPTDVQFRIRSFAVALQN